jgi:YYY domain-containing protein
MRKVIKNNHKLLGIVSLFLIILFGAYFRINGIDWDENYHLHPDERFLTMIETSIKPVENIQEFFDTNRSSLNPHNVLDGNGNQTFPFFVYGTFPIMVVRYVGELFGKTNYSEIHLVGRYLSGLFDLGTVLVIFSISRTLFKKTNIAIIASFFYAFAALPIQISHYFIVDNFATFFCMLAFFAAVKITQKEQHSSSSAKANSAKYIFLKEWDGFGYYVLFSVALGLAAASKINSVVAAFLLPTAILFTIDRDYFRASNSLWKIHLKYLIIAGLMSFIVFRIFQPYAFSGPGFFNFSLNPKWIKNIMELSSLSSGLSNYPPSLQWTRRTFTFPIKNMFGWGMGISFGIVSLFGVVLMVIKLLKGDVRQYGLLVGWSCLYLIWQAVRWNPTMRYFLLIYPTLAIIAGWAVDEIPNIFTSKCQGTSNTRNLIIKIFLGVCMVGAFLWAFAFTGIYRKPMSRIEASEWIYRHLEGAINLNLSNGEEHFIQPIPYPKSFELQPGQELIFDFFPEFDMAVDQIAFDHIVAGEVSEENSELIITIESKNSQGLFEQVFLTNTFPQDGDFRGNEYIVDFPEPIQLTSGSDYRFSVKAQNPKTNLKFAGTISLSNHFDEHMVRTRIFEFSQPLRRNEPYRVTFKPMENAELSMVEIFRGRPVGIDENKIDLAIEIIDKAENTSIVKGKTQFKFSQADDFRGQRIPILLDEPIKIKRGTTYELVLTNESMDQSTLILSGSKTAKETDWDDALPLFMYGFNPFDRHSGVYQSDLNFQMYWDDNKDKFARFTSILDQADYIIFSSNRQWGSITQAPDKYPLSTYFYDQLNGCDSDDIQRCYIEAEANTLGGNLGYALGAIFKSEPNLFGLEFNTQFAEEAFSVYDHPKVIVFEKTDAFSYQEIIEKLSSIDVDFALNVSPQELEGRPGILELPEKWFQAQKEAGTWSHLFNYNALQNRNQFFGVILWYLTISILGWLMYPITRIGFKGLKYKGWAISRVIALVLLTFFVWILGSLGIPVVRKTIIFSIIILLDISGILFFKEKSAIVGELLNNKNQILVFEIASLLFFALFLLIRIGNPDLWHPYKGGEKPMDFAYFNAVIKSVKFPPYDPWNASGYINYYYWGFLLAAVPTKLLGIIPSIAYNLILPMFFSFTAMAAFCIGINMTTNEPALFKKKLKTEIWIGMITAVFLLVIGNLGTIKMFFQGFLRLAENNIALSSENVFYGIQAFIYGIKEFLNRGGFNYYPGDWYWIPSRAIPGEPITEFPYFTFLYGDPHAHLFALPITLISLAWTISLLAEKMGYEKNRTFYAKLIIGGIIIGSLRPTNTWDYPVSLTIACVGILYAYIRYRVPSVKWLPGVSQKVRRFLFAVISASTFGVLSYFLFNQFSKWYGQGYSSIEFWKGDKTPFGSYLTHWGFFYFIILSWTINEAIRWMKDTPLSDLKKYIPHRKTIIVFLSLITIAIVILSIIGIEISVLTLPLLTFFFTLLFMKKYTDKDKLVFFLTCIGLGLTLIVELVVLSGDIGRMNTVFKFYLQAWTCLSISTAWFAVDLIKRLKNWNSKILFYWRIAAVILSSSVLLFPLIASVDKVSDRIAPSVPTSLDGMEFMRFASYNENSNILDLNQDYELIRWMQDNISGTPIIMEANVPEYRWGSRISIYTGLPTVIGWNWHQRQQRIINPSDWIFDRVNDVSKFYSDTDLNSAQKIIDKYDIDYIVIGQLEKAIYPQGGIDKFINNGTEGFEIRYASDDTFLLQVIQ